MNRHVLFVEDEDLLRTVYRRQAQGTFAADVASSPAEALTAIATTEYAVVVTDMSMPDMNGIELAAVIRQRSPHSVLILLTAHTEAKVAAVDNGMLFRVLGKPCPREKLLQVMEEAAQEYERRCLTDTESLRATPAL